MSILNSPDLDVPHRRKNTPASPHLNSKAERSPKADKIEFCGTIHISSGNPGMLLAEWCAEPPRWAVRLAGRRMLLAAAQLDAHLADRYDRLRLEFDVALDDHAGANHARHRALGRLITWGRLRLWAGRTRS